MIGIISVAILSSCGSTVSTDLPEDKGNTSGTLGVLLKDSPPGPPSLAISQIWVTVKGVSLKMDEEGEMSGLEGTTGANGGDWFDVFKGTAVYDILALKENKAALLTLVPIPPERRGPYKKVRFEIDGEEGKNCFYRSPGSADSPSAPCSDSDALLLSIPSGEIDIEFPSPIYLGQGTTQYIVLDILPPSPVRGGTNNWELSPVIYAYQVSSILEANHWSDIYVDSVEGYVENIRGCDDPERPDILTLSYKQEGMTISMDITDAHIVFSSSGESLSCRSLRPGQVVAAGVHISGDGTMIAERVEIR